MSHERPILASTLCACALAGVVAVAVGWPARKGRAYLLRDIVGQFHPWRAYARMELVDGVLPLWNPYNQGGNPFAANSQAEVFYPLAAMLLTGHFGLALMGFLAGHAALAAAGMFVLLRMHGCVRWAAMLAGAVYALSGWSATRLEFAPVFATAAWAPLVMAALLHCVRRPSLLGALGASVLLALQCLAGSPNHFFICGLGYSIVVGVAWFGVVRRPHNAARAIVALACAGLLAAALCAVQLLPLLEFSSLSLRAGKLDFEFASRRAIFPAHLRTLVEPFAYGGPGYAGYHCPQLREFWNGCYYVGIAPLVLIAAALMSLLRRARRGRTASALVCGLIAMGLLGLGLAMGRDLPLFRWCHEHLPVFGKFRWPSKFMFLSAFALAALAGLSLDRLMQALRAHRRLGHALAGAALAVVLVDSISFSARINPTASVAFFDRGARRPSAAGSPRVLCDKATRSLNNYLYGCAQPEAFEWGRRLLLAYGNLLMAVDAAHADDPLALRRFGRVLVMAEDEAVPAAARKRILRMLSVGEVRRAKQVDALALDSIRNPARHIMATRVAAPLPRAWIAAKVVEKPPDEFGWLAAKGFDPARMVILPKGAATTRTQGSGGMATLIRRQAHDVQIEAAAGSEGWLVLNDAACPGWRAYADGRRAAILLANFCMRAVRVDTAPERVRFVYAPRSVKWGAGISLLALAATVLVGLASRRWATRSPARPSTGPRA